MIKVVVVAVLLISAFKASAQDLITVTLEEYNNNWVTTNFHVPEGSVAEIIFASGGIRLGNNSPYPNSQNFSDPVYFNQSSKYPFYISGPNYVWFVSGLKTIVTYRIIPNVAVGSPTTNYIPASAVVIPADSNGSVRIILESSADLITWTEANPGLYGSSSSKRFFRVRAVNQ